MNLSEAKQLRRDADNSLGRELPALQPTPNSVGAQNAPLLNSRCEAAEHSTIQKTTTLHSTLTQGTSAYALRHRGSTIAPTVVDNRPCRRANPGGWG